MYCNFINNSLITDHAHSLANHAHIKMSNTKRAERAKRFVPVALVEGPSYGEHINAIGMVFSLVGLLMRVRAITTHYH